MEPSGPELYQPMTLRHKALAPKQPDRRSGARGASVSMVRHAQVSIEGLRSPALMRAALAITGAAESPNLPAFRGAT